MKKSCSAWAAYCRVSSGSDQQMESLKAQTEYYEKYIREHSEYTFAGIYADEGISGTDIKKREAFNRLMQDARDGHVDMIITKSLSRFGRNTLDCLNHIRDLKSLGVDVYFEKENIHTMRSEGEMLITLISAVAQNESLTQSENVKWGIHRKYERGNIKSVPCGKFRAMIRMKTATWSSIQSKPKRLEGYIESFLMGMALFKLLAT